MSVGQPSTSRKVSKRSHAERNQTSEDKSNSLVLHKRILFIDEREIKIEIPKDFEEKVKFQRKVNLKYFKVC